MGKLVEMTSREKGEPSRLTLEHASFVRFITVLAIAMGVITFFIGLAVSHFQHIVYTFVNGFLVVIVANVPQGSNFPNWILDLQRKSVDFCYLSKDKNV